MQYKSEIHQTITYTNKIRFVFTHIGNVMYLVLISLLRFDSIIHDINWKLFSIYFRLYLWVVTQRRDSCFFDNHYIVLNWAVATLGICFIKRKSPPLSKPIMPLFWEIFLFVNFLHQFQTNQQSLKHQPFGWNQCQKFLVLIWLYQFVSKYRCPN